MRSLKAILEGKTEKKKEKVFVETDPQEAFPNDTMSALKKQIAKMSKDLETDWKSAREVVDAAFEELEVPKPLAYLKKRWIQYNELISHAVKNLYDARGLKASWAKTV